MNIKIMKASITAIQLVLFFTSAISRAAMVETPTEMKTWSNNNNWTFVGKATNEVGERFYYYFDVQLKNTEKFVNIFMFNQANQEQLHYHFSQMQKKEEKTNSWQIGKAFVRYNSINNSWIFGMKDDVDRSFNFREELIRQPQDEKKTRSLISGLSLKFQNAKRLNGHITWGVYQKEAFVTADQNMYRHLSNTDNLSTLSPVQGVFCLLENGGYFSAVQVAKGKDKSISKIEWYNALGELIKVKPYLNIKSSAKKSSGLIIQVSNSRLEMTQSLTEKLNPILSVGFIKGKKEGVGFCFVDNIDLNFIPPAIPPEGSEATAGMKISGH